MKYKVIKSFRKTMSLQIKNWEVLVKAPFFTLDSSINSFVQKHINWIQDKLKLESRKKKYTSEDILRLKKLAKDYIPTRTQEFAFKFWLNFNSIKITSAKTRWWSCTSKKNLNFSFRLMDTPQKVIDYVIIHELAHLKHMNHSKNFWKEVEYMMPDYKNHELWLKKNWNLIT